ncbi:unnamed protein product, partial [Ectocarpus sp. 12 AP-2014]
MNSSVGLFCFHPNLALTDFPGKTAADAEMGEHTRQPSRLANRSNTTNPASSHPSPGAKRRRLLDAEINNTCTQTCMLCHANWGMHALDVHYLVLAHRRRACRGLSAGCTDSSQGVY